LLSFPYLPISGYSVADGIVVRSFGCLATHRGLAIHQCRPMSLAETAYGTFVPDILGLLGVHRATRPGDGTTASQRRLNAAHAPVVGVEIV
jgi:hypothetical protein